MTRYFCNYCNIELTDTNRIKPTSSYLRPYSSDHSLFNDEEVLINFSLQVIRSRNNTPLTDTDICFPCVLKIMNRVIETHRKA